MSADWWANGKQIVTASWDRTIKLWDVESAAVVHTLEGKLTILLNMLLSLYAFAIVSIRNLSFHCQFLLHSALCKA